MVKFCDFRKKKKPTNILIIFFWTNQFFNLMYLVFFIYIGSVAKISYENQ